MGVFWVLVNRGLRRVRAFAGAVGIGCHDAFGFYSVAIDPFQNLPFSFIRHPAGLAHSTILAHSSTTEVYP